MIRPPTIICKIILWGVCTTLCVVVLLQHSEITRLRAAPSVRQTPAPSNRTTPPATPPADVRPARPRRQLDGAAEQARKQYLRQVEDQLAEISKPFAQDIASTMLQAEVRDNQSVVTGGYPTADGKHQFTVLTPKRLKLADGSEMIQVDTKTIAVSPESTQQSGFASLATSAKNTLQHAESWDNPDVATALGKVSSLPGCFLMSSPSVTTLPGQQFTLQIASGDGANFSLAGAVDFSATGAGFIVKARVEQQDAPAAPDPGLAPPTHE